METAFDRATRRTEVNIPIAVGTRIGDLAAAESLAFALANAIDPPAPAFVVVLDDDNCTTGAVMVTDDDAALFSLLEVAAQIGPLRAMAVSDLDAGSNCDPGDVLEWEEAVGVLGSTGGQLVEWLVLSGCDARSKARDAPTPGLPRR